MKYFKTCLIPLFALWLLLPIYATEQPASPTLDTTTINTISGEKIHVALTRNGLRFQEIPDRIILLEFFGHSYPPCRASIPGYNTLQKKYPDDVTVIAIESWGLNKEKLKKYAKELGINYKVVAGSDAKKIFSFVQKLTGWAPNYGVPFLMLYAPGGKLVKSVPPQKLNETYVENLIEEIRKKK